jgi:hypothetical protein
LFIALAAFLARLPQPGDNQSDAPKPEIQEALLGEYKNTDEGKSGERGREMKQEYSYSLVLSDSEEGVEGGAVFNVDDSENNGYTPPQPT